MSRIGPLVPETMDDELRKEYDSLVRWRGGTPPPDGMFGGPFDVWLRSPQLCHKMREFGGLLWNDTALDRGIVELSISVAAWFWQSNVEWSHAATAMRFGIEPAVLDAVAAGRRPESSREDVLLAYDLSVAFLQGKALSQALFDRAIGLFGERGLVEIAETVGFYTAVAFTIRAFDVEPGADAPRPFARPEEA